MDDPQICATVQSLIILHVFSLFLRVSKAVIAMRHGSKEELAPKRPDLAVKLDDHNSARDEPTKRRMRHRRWTLSNQKSEKSDVWRNIGTSPEVSFCLSFLP